MKTVSLLCFFLFFLNRRCLLLTRVRLILQIDCLLMFCFLYFAMFSGLYRWQCHLDSCLQTSLKNKNFCINKELWKCLSVSWIFWLFALFTCFSSFVHLLFFSKPFSLQHLHIQLKEKLPNCDGLQAQYFFPIFFVHFEHTHTKKNTNT